MKSQSYFRFFFFFWVKSYFRYQNNYKNLKPLLSIFYKFYRSTLQKNKEAHPAVQHPTTHAAICHHTPPYAAVCHHRPQNLLPFPSSYRLGFEGMGLKDFLWQWVGDLVVHCVRAKMEIGMVTLGFDDIQDLFFQLGHFWIALF